MSITELSIKRPSLVIVVFAMLLGLGLFGYASLPYELIPEISPPFISVATVYPGASPSEVERAVTKPIEDAAASVDRVRRIWSTSSENVSLITLEFLSSTDPMMALQDVQRRVNAMLASLPAGVKTPEVSKFGLTDLPVLRLGVTSKLQPTELFELIGEQVRPALAQIPGVGLVGVVGGSEREIAVLVHAEALRARGLSILQVATAVKAANVDVPAGKVADLDREYSVRVLGKMASLETLRDTVVARVGDPTSAPASVRLRDVAVVQDGVKAPSTVTRVNGEQALGLLIQRQSNANAVDMARDVRARLAVLEAEHSGAGLRFDVAQDGTLFTLQAAQAVKHDLLLAVMLVALVMLLFLHGLRDPLIVMVAIPTSLVTTFIGMYAFGFSLNLMTLLAMSLAIGILVDDAMVVHERIAHHLHLGKDKRTAALDGRQEIGFSAVAITLVDVVVFVPLALVPGLVGNILRQFAVVMVISTLVSLLVSFTLTPMLASRFIKRHDLTGNDSGARFGRWFEARLERVSNVYVYVLRKSFRHRVVVALSAALLFAAAIGLLARGTIGSEFLSAPDRSELSAVVELPQGTSLRVTDEVARRIESELLAMPEVRKVFATIGSASEGFFGEAAPNAFDLTVTLVDKEKRQRSALAISQDIKGRLLGTPGAKVRVSPISIFGTTQEAPIVVDVIGPDRDQLLQTARQIEAVMRSVPGTDDVRLSVPTGKPELQIHIDHEKLDAFKLSLAEVGYALRVALSGDEDSKFRLSDTEYTLRIQLDEASRSRTADIERVVVHNALGQQIELRQFATVESALAPAKLARRTRNNVVFIYSGVVGRASGDVGGDIQAKVAALKLPPSVKVVYEGDLENQEESFSRLLMALLAAIAAVYLVMVALYDSFAHPLVVLFSIPFAVVGAIFALALTGSTLNIFSILGLIMLVGLVGKNAILLVDRVNHARAEGLERIEALIDAGRTRLRPILMTTLAMVFGMVPIALASGAAAELKSGLAWVLIGGLLSSLLLTLIVVPTVYVEVERLRDFMLGLPRRVALRSKRVEKSGYDVVANT